MNHPTEPKRIAIITASPPGENGVGQNYIRDLVKAIDDHHLHVFALLKELDEWRIEDRQCINEHTLLERRYEYSGGVAAGRINRWSATLAFHAMTVRHAKRLGREIAAIVSLRKFDAVLLVLESPLLILMGQSLCQQLPCPLQILVWDHPEHVSNAFGHEGLRKKRLLNAFADVVANASAGLTVAEEMKALLSNLNPDLPIRLFRSPVRVTDHNDALDRQSKNEPFILGFAGSVTAPDEFEVLQQALDQLQWNIRNRPIQLRLFGKRFTLRAAVQRDVQYRGFLPTQVDVVRELSKCDVCFLPQPFAASSRFVAEYSFPTKLSSYLASGRPVLVVAPPHASLAKFQRCQESASENESSLGFHCKMTEPSMLSDLIRQICTDREFYRRGCERAIDCAERSFRFDAGRLNVRLTLGLDGGNECSSNQLL